MSDLIAQGGAGGLGALLGTFASFLGFKSRLDAVDKRLDTLSEKVMYEDTCGAKCEGMGLQVENQNILLTEMRKDIKKLLARNS